MFCGWGWPVIATHNGRMYRPLPPSKPLFGERDFQEVERAAASGLRDMFQSETPHARGAGWLRAVWLTMPRERQFKVEKIHAAARRKVRTAEALALAVRAGCADLLAAIRWLADRDHEDDAYGQSSPLEFAAEWAARALEAGFPAQDAQMQIAAELAVEVSAREARQAEYSRQSRAVEAALEPHNAAAQAAIDRLKCRFAPSQLPSRRSVAEAMLAGESAEAAALRMAEARREQEGPEAPDTFGYCHGTDFAGGEW